MNHQNFTWGDFVRVVTAAPEKCRPGELADVCGILTVDNVENSEARGEPIGTTIYTVEFEDGVSVEIPERYLEKVNPT